VSRVGVEEFDRLCRRSSVPVIIEDALDDWPATSLWQDHRRLLELVGADTEVFCRQVADPAAAYREDYEAVRFGQLLEEVFEHGGSSNYLTQGLIFRPEGFLGRVGRAVYPALLDALAVDCRLPPFVDPAGLIEGVMWLGSGGQVTPLHFDAAENLHAAIRGRKQWLLFPPSELRHLCIDGNEARDTMTSSFEQLTEGGRWRGGPVAHGYVCHTGPGDMLYLPNCYLHQVYSSGEPTISVNFWYVDLNSARDLARTMQGLSIRRGGIHQRPKRAAYAALALGGLLSMRARYVLRPDSLPASEPALGTTYETKQQFL